MVYTSHIHTSSKRVYYRPCSQASKASKPSMPAPCAGAVPPIAWSLFASSSKQCSQRSLLSTTTRNCGAAQRRGT